MNPVSIEEKSSQTSSSQNSPPSNEAGLAPTLKAARFPDSGALSDWISPPDVTNDSRPAGHRESDIFDASLRALSHRRSTDNSTPSLKMVEFFVELPAAQSVQLAADFTDWEEAPLDMIHFESGIWSLTVPLPPGIYAYRFLVDGEWYDNPRAVRPDPNNPGPAKAYVKVK